MLLEDSTRTHVGSPVAVVELFESTNQPMVQPAGRSAQAAQAAVLAIDDEGALRVLVVLTLIESQENVVYASTDAVSTEELPAALEEGLLFAESMGFILDGTGWSRMDATGRQQLAARLAAFREPGPGKEKSKSAEQRKPAADPLAQVARLFAAFAALFALATLSCGGPTAEQRRKSAEINYDLGTNAFNQGDAQTALTSYLQAEKDDPDVPQLHNALGLLYWYSLGRTADAEAEFKQALALQPDFSEAQNNYGAFLISRNRFAEAIPQFESAIANPLYSQRTFAECNLAWALYKTGAVQRAEAQLTSALRIAPKFCKGWQQLGTIYAEESKLDEALEALRRYAEACPESADAQLHLALVLVRKEKVPEAKQALERCAQLGHTADAPTALECQKQLKSLGAP